MRPGVLDWVLLALCGMLCLPAQAAHPKDDPVAVAQAWIDQGQGREALRLLLPEARRGDPEAAYWLGRLYFYDAAGVPRNDRVSARWFARSARAGHPGSQYKLGGLYFAGRGVRKDMAAAALWWRAAARQGHAEALNNLGALLATGQGVERNTDLARALQIVAAQLGSEAAQENVRAKGEHPAARHMAAWFSAHPQELDARLAQLVIGGR